MKRRIAVMLATVLIAMLFAGCAQSHIDTFEPEDITEVTASDAIFSSYLYTVEDREGAQEIAGMIAGITYEEADGEIDLTGEVYSVTLYDIDDNAYSFFITPDGLMYIGDDWEHTQRITNGFDCEELKALLEQYDANEQPTL